MLQIISGDLKGRKLFVPKNSTLRPTSSMLRKSVFDILQYTCEGSVFLDLFAGTGAMGIEALSRKASFAVFIDQQKSAMSSLKKNLELFHLENVSRVYLGDAFQILKKLKISFDIVYIDPPYERFQDSHFIFPLMEELSLHMKMGGKVFIEEPYSSRREVPYVFPHFLHLNSRRVGSALLQQYQFLKE